MSIVNAIAQLLASATTAAYTISRSLRLRSSASAYLTRTPASAGNQQKFTWSGWVKRGVIGSRGNLFQSSDNGASSGNAFGVYFDSTNTLNIYNYATGYQLSLITNQVFRDPSAWYHIVLAIDTTQATASNRALLYVNGSQVTSFSTATYPTQNTNLNINDSGHALIIGSWVSGASYSFFLDGYLTEINFIDGQALTPSSFGQIDSTTGVWAPLKYAGSYGTNGFYLPCNDNSSLEALGFDMANGNPELISNGQFVTNTTGWTALNGTTLSWQSGAVARLANVSSNAGIAYVAISTVIGQTYYVKSAIAAYNPGAAGRTVGIRKSDDSAYTVNPVLVCSATSATQISGTFTATATTTYIQMFVDVFGTGNSDFSFVSVSLGGYKNHWKPTGISLTAGATYDSMIDTPTIYDDGNTGRGNYATLLPTAGQGNGTYSDGNLGFVSSTLNQWRGAHASLFMPSGKFYFEATIQTLTANNFFMIGAVGIQTLNTMYGNYPGFVANGWSVQCNGTTGGTKYNNNGTTNVSNASFANWVVGDTLQCAVDVDAGKIWFGRNNVWLEGSPSAGTTPSFSNLTGPIAPAVGIYSTAGDKLALNCGQRAFAYTPPTAFKAVNTFNLADGTIKKGNQHFDVSLFTGTGSNAAVSGLAFSPDIVWRKGRSVAESNLLFDTVRGAQNMLSSNSTAAETTSGALVSFDANGFTGAGTNLATYVAWQFNAGGNTVSNTAGSITSSVRANPTAGISVVTMPVQASGTATVGHGLGVAPAMIITKFRSGVSFWNAYHQALGNTKYIQLESTAAATTDSTRWNNTSPTSTVFSLGTAFAGSFTAVAYCFAEVAGFSKFGSYTGNGAADGVFVYTGMRTRWVMIKRIDAINDWVIFDTARDTYNYVQNILWADLSTAETAGGTTTSVDILSNGFKTRGAGASINASGGTYIYAAFAENPFRNALAR